MPGEKKADAELVRDLLTGDQEAFTQFANAYHARLSQYSFLMCGQREDAEDVAQETLMKVFQSIDRLREPDRLKTWVFRIAKNECLMKRRKSLFAPQTELSLDELRPKLDGTMAGIEIADWDSVPDNLLQDSELQNALTTSIQQVPEIYRSVVLLRDVEGLSTSETVRGPGDNSGYRENAATSWQAGAAPVYGPVPSSNERRTASVTDNECARIFALLSEYLDEELPAATCDELEQHLGGCPKCVEFVRSLRRSIELCRQYGGCRNEAQLDPNVMAGLRRAYAEMLSKRRTSVDGVSDTRNSDRN